MTLEAFQSDLRRSYVGGGPGTIVSGLVWAAAAFVAQSSGIATGFVVLFLGGMFIFPLGMLICRMVFGRKAPEAANPGGRVVIETLPGMFAGLFVAYLLIPTQPDLVFPVAAMAVGAHYFSFRTAYGDIIFWILGGLMTAVGAVYALKGAQLPLDTASVIAGLEIVFGIALTAKALRNGA